MREPLVGRDPQGVVVGVGIAAPLCEAVGQTDSRQNRAACGKSCERSGAGRAKSGELVDIAFNFKVRPFASKISNHDPDSRCDLLLDIEVPVLDIRVFEIRIDEAGRNAGRRSIERRG